LIFPNEVKENFPIFANNQDLIYLDSAATAHKPQVVIDTVVDFYTRYNANVHRGIYQLSEKATDAYEQARSTVAYFIGANAKQVVFTPGTTASSNMIALGLLEERLAQSDMVISSVAEHHSNFLPIQTVAKKKDCQLQLIGLDDDEDFHYEQFEGILKKHTDRIKVIALSAVSNVLGYKLDLARISKLVRQSSPNAIIIIDSAQLIGHEEFSLHSPGVDIDFLFFSGHKLMGETGIGVMWGKYELLTEMTPALVGGGMIARVTEEKSSFAKPPTKFEAGTPHIAGALSLAAACDYLEKVGLTNIAQHQQRLVKKSLEGLARIEGLSILGPKNHLKRSSLVSFTIEGIHAHDVAQFLADKHVAVRAGHHCTQILHKQHYDISGSVRASYHVYNSLADVEALLAAVEACRDYFSNLKND
jgi:cysteine desulfurase/selenocysteine lyase